MSDTYFDGNKKIMLEVYKIFFNSLKGDGLATETRDLPADLQFQTTIVKDNMEIPPLTQS